MGFALEFTDRIQLNVYNYSLHVAKVNIKSHQIKRKWILEHLMLLALF